MVTESERLDGQTALSVKPPGTRERRRRELELDLRESALQLFAERGYDDTSVHEIAERAGVSRRTFFRYFKSKEDLLFSGDPGFTLIVPRAEFERAAEQADLGGADLSDLTAVGALLESYVPALEARRERLIAFRAAVASSAALRGRTLDSYAFVERWIQATVRSARPVDPSTAAVLGRLGAAMLNLATERWVADPSVTLVSRIHEVFHEIELAAAPVEPVRVSKTAPEPRRRR